MNTDVSGSHRTPGGLLDVLTSFVPLLSLPRPPFCPLFRFVCQLGWGGLFPFEWASSDKDLESFSALKVREAHWLAARSVFGPISAQ